MTGNEARTLLVVDDNEMNRDMLARRLARHGHHVVIAEDGIRALNLLKTTPVDMILLDLMMPGLSGYEVLERLKADPNTAHLPVIVISAIDELDSIVKCLELGAEDHLPKPFNPVILRARVEASLNKKRLHDLEQQRRQEIEVERQRSDELLHALLPEPIAQRLKDGEATIADDLSDVGVLFADLSGFTTFAAQAPASTVVSYLDGLFAQFDLLVRAAGVEKIKTIGDAYMVAGGLPGQGPGHFHRLADLALSMARITARTKRPDGQCFQLRVGLHAGPVVAGVIGRTRMVYDLWGDTVNVASRMESQGVPGRVQCTEEFAKRLGSEFNVEPREAIEVKGRGKMETFWITGRTLVT
jgi:adenylate cyclase